MLDMGFKQDIDFIINEIKQKSTKYQMALFSATVPKFVQEIAQNSLGGNFKYYNFAKNIQNRTAKNIEHIATYLGDQSFSKMLMYILKENLPVDGKAIVFTKTKVESQRISERLKMAFHVGCINGDVA